MAAEKKEAEKAESFNRTFMELKLLAKVGKRNLGGRFNRTFMELKLCPGTPAGWAPVPF